MKLMLAGGGTGGHIYPALAVAKQLQKKENNYRILYVGTLHGLESSIIPAQNLPFKNIDIRGMPRKIGKDLLLFSFDFAKGCYQAKKIINEFSPDVVLGTGGYVCGPVVFAAWISRIPTVIHEQNVIPGITNKFLSKFANQTLISFKDSEKYFSSSSTILTGNPRASQVGEISKNNALEKLGLFKDKKTLLIVSGSQGAEVINNNVISIIDELLKYSWLQIIYVTGEKYFDDINERIKNKINTNIKIFSYLKEMQLALACADLFVSRAGATTIAEITAFGIPCILIPSPNVTNDHQRINALTLEKENAAFVIEENNLTPGVLKKNILQILNDEQSHARMKSASLNLGAPNAAQDVYNILRELAQA